MDPNTPLGVVDLMRADQASAAAGITVTELPDSTIVATMTVRQDMLNGYGMTHGGLVFLLADTAFACACRRADIVVVAAGADISFLAPTGIGDQLTATARRRAERGRSGIYDVTVSRATDQGTEVVAEFRGRSRAVSPSGSSAPSSTSTSQAKGQ